MVITPWQESPVSFVEAAETGTQKVINEHSTIGLVITTDGSITEIPRASYQIPEERVINELKAIGKPFIVILNSVHPDHQATREIAEQIRIQHQVPVIPMDCMHLETDQINAIIQEVLYMFPVREMRFDFPRWIEELDGGHWLRARFEGAIYDTIGGVNRIRDIDQMVSLLRNVEDVREVLPQKIDLGTGTAVLEMTTDSGLFYRVLEEVSGFPISGDQQLMRIMKELAVAKREYDKMAEALEQVKVKGYGVVQPQLSELKLAEPELIRHGNRFGVKLKASAPSIHMIKAEITTEVTPIVGTEKQGEEFVQYLTEEFEKDPSRIWQTDFFGKSMYDLLKEGIQSKLTQMPDNAQEKLQETLTKIINEGSGGLICIIL